ncbi:DP-EP family protein [Shewanella sp. UCD-KL12]|uniref:DP-EP family protein n=1 Tax=Shewanella sp. UCD-KL12 TaxID=1917163 RepID=UPI0009712BC0|nr:DP-EP family protein [Shewanella sp. UCD-KL12]
MSKNEIVVNVSITGDDTNPEFSFTPNPVVLTKPKAKVSYNIDPKNNLDLAFVGAVFPQQNERTPEGDEINPHSVLQDINSIKIKNAAQTLSIKDSNHDHGVIGIRFVFANKQGNTFESQDPQIKNQPEV